MTGGPAVLSGWTERGWDSQRPEATAWGGQIGLAIGGALGKNGAGMKRNARYKLAEELAEDAERRLTGESIRVAMAKNHPMGKDIFP